EKGPGQSAPAEGFRLLGKDGDSLWSQASGRGAPRPGGRRRGLAEGIDGASFLLPEPRDLTPEGAPRVKERERRALLAGGNLPSVSCGKGRRREGEDEDERDGRAK